MSDESLREIERKLIENGNADLVRWVRGMLMGAQAQQVTVNETPIEQDAPLWERIRISSCAAGGSRIFVPYQYDFMLMGISVIPELPLGVADVLEFCANARATLFVDSWNEEFCFPMAVLAAARQHIPELSSRPCLRMPPRPVARASGLHLKIDDVPALVAPISMIVAFHGRRIVWVPAHKPRLGGGGCADDCHAGPPHHKPRIGDACCADDCEAPEPHVTSTVRIPV